MKLFFLEIALIKGYKEAKAIVSTSQNSYNKVEWNFCEFP